MAPRHFATGPALAAGLLTALLAMTAGAQTFTFTKVTDASNPIVTLGPAAPGSFIGASWVDSDLDGDLDLFIVQKGLFRNDGAGAFTHLPGAITNQGLATGVTWADVDNDGDLDAYVAGGAPNGSSLHLNQGGNSFARVLGGAIGDTVTNLGWAAAFGDHDGDGRVDLVLAAPVGFNGITGPNRFFRGGPGGAFASDDTSVVATGTAFYTVPTWADMDGDGDLDLAIGSGPGGAGLAPDNLYRNRRESKPGWFQRWLDAPLGTDLHDGQVYHWVDYDNDGDLDAFLTNFGGNANDLYRNDGGGTFVRLTGAEAGPIVTQVGPSLSAAWEDFDNDGDLDCFVTQAQGFAGLFYRNDGALPFVAVSVTGLTSAATRWGTTTGDWDRDGRVDLYVTGTTAGAGLYRNETASGNRWIRFQLSGVTSNRSAIGALVRVRAVIGGTPRWQVRQISSQNAFDGMNALEAHFGLGDATVADSVIVEWPSGQRDVHTGLPAGAQHLLVESSVTAVRSSLASLDVDARGVRIEWFLHDAAGEALTVERSADGFAWTELATPIVTGGSIRVEDTDVSPGQHLEYRLMARDAAGRTLLDQVSVDVPAEVALAIRALGRGADTGTVRLRLTLPDDGSGTAARVELFDPAGRRLAKAPVAPGAAGAHTVELRTAGALRPGVYLARLTRGNRAVTARVPLVE